MAILASTARVMPGLVEDLLSSKCCVLDAYLFCKQGAGVDDAHTPVGEPELDPQPAPDRGYGEGYADDRCRQQQADGELGRGAP